ncbi:Uncharacterised protein [Vibrio cholerae]|nr:Uncharacterised protein [Vibrio cholerae]
MHQLQIHRVSGVVNAGNHERSIHEAKQRRTNHREITRHCRFRCKCHTITNHATKWADEGVSKHH